jgi:hemoglobin
MPALNCRLPLAAALVAALAIGGALAQAPARYTPGPQNVELPADWQQRFIRYATVDHAARKIIRHLYVNPEAFAATRAGAPLPHGTVLVMADTRARLDAAGNPLLDQAGRFIPEPGWTGIFVQQKQAGWGEGYGPEKRNGEWEYARYNPDMTRHPGPVEACFTCHLQTRAQQDFAFNYWDYAQTRR